MSSLPADGGVNPLLLACLSQQHRVLKLLLKHAPGFALRGDGCGMSPLHYAAWSGSAQCLKVLAGHVTWREGMARRDKWGRTPLIIAAAKVGDIFDILKLGGLHDILKLGRRYGIVGGALEIHTW